MKALKYLIITAIAGIFVCCTSSEKKTVLKATFKDDIPQQAEITCPELNINEVITISGDGFTYEFPQNKTEAQRVNLRTFLARDRSINLTQYNPFWRKSIILLHSKIFICTCIK